MGGGGHPAPSPPPPLLSDGTSVSADTPAENPFLARMARAADKVIADRKAKEAAEAAARTAAPAVKVRAAVEAGRERSAVETRVASDERVRVIVAGAPLHKALNK